MRHYGILDGLLLVGLVTLCTGCDQFALKPKPAPVAPTTSAAPGQPMPGTQREVAGVGSGIKGRSLDDPGVVNAIAQPAKSYFAVKERAVFEIQIPHALQLYKAEAGAGPATHEEFIEKIITANQIALPALPDGHRYVYDPQTEQLMVEKPAK